MEPSPPPLATRRGWGDLDVTIAAALTSHALNVGYTPVVSPGVKALTRARISTWTGATSARRTSPPPTAR